MFILFFLVFTLIFTLFENTIFAGIFLVLVIVWMIVYQLISHKKIFTRQAIYCLFGAFVLAGCAFGIKEIRYYGGIKIWIPVASPNGEIKPEWGNAVWKNQKMFVAKGIITDLSNKWKYVFTAQDDDYLLYSKKEYQIGNHLRLVGKFTPPTPSKIEGWWFWKVTSSTFKIPLFSWSFDYPKRLKMKWRKWTIYETNSIKDGNIETLKHWNIWVINSMKKSIQEKVIQVYGKNKISWLILGMVIGDKSQIPESEYQFFIDSGLVHLIAVSGGNILMIVVFLQCVLFFLPFYVRLGLILLTITGYSLICGMDSSVFRALLMGGLSMVALFRGREINIRRLLSISAIIMLIINPYFLAYDTGFLLSYSALIGLIYFGEKTTKCSNDEINPPSASADSSPFLKGGQRVIVYIYKTYISPSIGASIGIFPIIIFFMGKMNLLGIIGNLFVLPIVPFVMIYGFASIYAYELLNRKRLLWIEKILVQYIYKISELLSTYGLYISVTGLRVKYLFLAWFLVWFVWWRFRKNKTE